MPPLFMPTGPAYQKLDERKELSIDKTEDCLKALEERDWEGLADSLSNDFELGLFPNSRDSSRPPAMSRASTAPPS